MWKPRPGAKPGSDEHLDLTKSKKRVAAFVEMRCAGVQRLGFRVWGLGFMDPQTVGPGATA